MITKLFTIYDTKAGAYLPPFYMQSTGQAMRAFEDTVNDVTTQFGKHPEDFILFEVGSFNDQDCTFVINKTNITLAKAIELVTQPNNDPTFDVLQKAN